MTALFAAIDLTTLELVLAMVAVFVAGMVRGFSGFALSALAMASLATIIPPIELIPVCGFMEMAASFMMIRGGWKEANKKVSFGLAIGSATGSPIGLYLTNMLDVATSKIIALFIILTLSLLQLLKVRATFLATNPGLYLSGVTAGVATGLASVGGMVVALYVLARNAPAREMRASLVLYLFIGMFTGFFYLYLYGMLTQAVFARSLVLVPLCVLGVIVGKALFVPQLEAYYKPFCLVLLMVLAGSGLLRLGVGV
ncbi:MAG: sulfite exporter TauE/SafE family protein [Pseudomonadota bacterium]